MNRPVSPSSLVRHERVEHPLARLSTSERRAIIHLGMTEEQRAQYLATHPHDHARLERAFLKRLRKAKRHARRDTEPNEPGH